MSIIVRCELYRNDFDRKEFDKKFFLLESLREWLFQICNWDYATGMFFTSPDKPAPMIDHSSISVRHSMYGGAVWVHMIQDSVTGGILYSDGKYTNKQKYISAEVRDWLRESRGRQQSQKWNFI